MSGHSQNLSLFYKPVYDRAIKNIEWLEYRPVGQISSEGALEFSVSGNNTKYIDLKNTRIKIKCKIVQSNGNPIPNETDSGKEPDRKVGPVNLFLQSMWRQVDVSLQQQVISPDIATKYPYRAYLETLLNYSDEVKTSQLGTQLYAKDIGDLDSVDPDNGTNVGLLQRSLFTKGSKVVDLEGPVYVDICEQNRYLLNGVQVHFKFWPSSNEFKLMTTDTGANYKVEIVEAMLKVCLIDVSPDIMLAHADTLKKGPASYYYNRSSIKSYGIAKGQFGISIEDMYQGEVPSQVVIGLVSSQAYMGSYGTNPFNFKHHNCNFAGFYVDGKSMPTEPITPNYANSNFTSAYITTFGENYEKNSSHSIRREEYAKGYCLYVFDICQNYCERYGIQRKPGHTRLEIKFSKPLPEATTLIAYAKFPGLLEIDENRSVTII